MNFLQVRSLSSREEQRLRVSENRVLRRIFGSKRDDVTGGWRKIHNEELHNFYFNFRPPPPLRSAPTSHPPFVAVVNLLVIANSEADCHVI
jgi:hypothetical protein